MGKLWIDWKRVSSGPYWYARLPNHPKCNSGGYVLEHRIIMENKVNRLLLPTEIVHHKNGDRKDNRIKNLQLMKAKDHSTMHARQNCSLGNPSIGHGPVKQICWFCKQEYPIRYGHRQKLTKSKTHFVLRSTSIIQ